MPNNTARPIETLPPAPSHADMRFCAQHGVTYRELLDARHRGTVNQLVSKSEPVSNMSASKQEPALRPWHPYRSKWEADYAGYLRALEQVKLIAAFEYEPEKLEIGVGAKYTPDFRVTRLDGSREWREVKGYRREAAMVRIKAAALRFPGDRFVLVTKADGQWKHTTIGAPR